VASSRLFPQVEEAQRLCNPVDQGALGAKYGLGGLSSFEGGVGVRGLEQV
jgi:hypothetical protein